MSKHTSNLLLIFVLGSTLAFAADSSSVQQSQNWVRMQQTDRVSGAQSAAYALTGDTEDLDRRPSIVLTCDGEREPSVIYHTSIKLASQAHDVKNYYADSIWASVKVDNGKAYRALWQIVPGPNNDWAQAVIDKKTLRYLFAGEQMRVSFRDYQDEQHIDQFDLTGLGVDELQPYCPSRWIAKNNLSDAARPVRLASSR